MNCSPFGSIREHPQFLGGFILFMYNTISSFVSSVLWCLPWFPLKREFVLFNSNTTGVTRGAGTPYPSVTPESPLVFNGVRIAHFLIICSILSFIVIVLIFLMFFLELQLLVIPMISSNFPLTITGLLESYICIQVYSETCNITILCWICVFINPERISSFAIYSCLFPCKILFDIKFYSKIKWPTYEHVLVILVMFT